MADTVLRALCRRAGIRWDDIARAERYHLAQRRATPQAILADQLASALILPQNNRNITVTAASAADWC